VRGAYNGGGTYVVRGGGAITGEGDKGGTISLGDRGPF
jgi:hypothetical protein